MKTNYESYAEGIKESWEVFKAISKLSNDAVAQIFGLDNLADAKNYLLSYDPLRVVREYNEYQAKLKAEKEIHVGDVVVNKAGVKAVVIDINVIPDSSAIVYGVMNEYGTVNYMTNVRKCNKHIEFVDWLIDTIKGAKPLD